MAELWERLFAISDFYVSGVPFPFERLELDSEICLKREEKKDCVACIAVKRKEPFLDNGSEQAILEIATIYALVTGFSFRITPLAAFSLNSLEELGKHKRGTIEVSVEGQFSEENLKKYSAKLEENWQKTRDVWKKLRTTLLDRKSLRLALFYHYRCRLDPEVSYRQSLDEAFVDATIGLEALLNEDSRDITYKLAARGALLLSFSEKHKDKDAFTLLKNYYNKRSRILHGSEREVVTQSEHMQIQEFLQVILESCIALSLSLNRVQIIKSLDKALVSPKEREELKSAIQNGYARLGL